MSVDHVVNVVSVDLLVSVHRVASVVRVDRVVSAKSVSVASVDPLVITIYLSPGHAAEVHELPVYGKRCSSMNNKVFAVSGYERHINKYWDL